MVSRGAAAGAAALLALGSLAGPSLATEFDILGEPTPTKNYFVDDASVLSKATRSDLNKRLSILEVRRNGTAKHPAVKQQTVVKCAALQCDPALIGAPLSATACLLPADHDGIPRGGRDCAQARV